MATKVSTSHVGAKLDWSMTAMVVGGVRRPDDSRALVFQIIQNGADWVLTSMLTGGGDLAEVAKEGTRLQGEYKTLPLAIAAAEEFAREWLED